MSASDQASIGLELLWLLTGPGHLHTYMDVLIPGATTPHLRHDTCQSLPFACTEYQSTYPTRRKTRMGKVHAAYSYCTECWLLVIIVSQMYSKYAVRRTLDQMLHTYTYIRGNRTYMYFDSSMYPNRDPTYNNNSTLQYLLSCVSWLPVQPGCTEYIYLLRTYYATSYVRGMFITPA